MPSPTPRLDVLDAEIDAFESALQTRFNVTATVIFEVAGRKQWLCFGPLATQTGLALHTFEDKKRVPLKQASLRFKCVASKHLIGLIQALWQEELRVVKTTDEAIDAFTKARLYLTEKP